MSRIRASRFLPGFVASLAFIAVLHVPGWLESLPFSLPVWMGSLFTANWTGAAIIGTILILGIGTALGEGYRRWDIPHPIRQTLWPAGVSFGIVLWLLGGSLGFWALDRLSPVLRQGIDWAPKFLGSGLGPLGNITWAAAVGLYTAFVAALTHRAG